MCYLYFENCTDFTYRISYLFCNATCSIQRSRLWSQYHEWVVILSHSAHGPGESWIFHIINGTFRHAALRTMRVTDLLGISSLKFLCFYNEELVRYFSIFSHKYLMSCICIYLYYFFIPISSSAYNHEYFLVQIDRASHGALLQQAFLPCSPGSAVKTARDNLSTLTLS